MQPVMERTWSLKEYDAATLQALLAGGDISPLVARLLCVRGINSREEMKQFLSPSLADMGDPFLLKGMAEAVERLAIAKKRGETICIHGDYDVDGVTSVALLLTFLQGVGFPAVYVIPLRLEEGYGLSTDGVDEAVRLGASVLITVDCGITSLKEAAYCREMGIDLIVTDHHTPGENLPEALAVINPLQPGCSAPFRQLAGVGLAFKLAIALRSRLRADGCFASGDEPNLREYLDLAALGTIADLVPLRGENRIIAAFGLKELTASSRTGIRALKKVAAVNDPVGCGDVGFRLAPRLNAAGRLDDAKRGVELLLSSDPNEAAIIAAELDAANRERQEIEKEILADALARAKSSAMTGRSAIVMASDNWHPGVIGIVASRVVEAFHRPVILISLQDGVGKGSGRSIPALHLYDAIAACSEHLLKFGGHKQAAGLTVDETTLEAFIDLFDEVVAGQLTEEDLTPVLQIDAELSPEEITPALVGLVAPLRPFGMGNPEPLFMLRGARVVQSRVLKDAHLKLRVEAGGRHFEAIGFGMAAKGIDAGVVDIAFVPELNVWNGRESLQLRLKDMRRSGVEHGAR
ncbi:MAG TPA: single-stranded-DNA-specific exonuclease RecJ [Geobacteraceae bacterium]|nr:single-stranded-DNA-specific exonuclease RecJ [Geobacteraceae bacterium]